MEPARHGPLSGRTLGPYSVGALIGRGGMGEVYRARDTRLGRDVALKTLPAAALDDPAARGRLLDEARHAATVVHPFVAAVYDVLDASPAPVVVMELVEGRTLAELGGLAHAELGDAPLDDDTGRWRVTREIVEALAAIHDAGLAHGDLKPGNVMLTPAGHVKLLDFGLARRPVALPDGAATARTEPAPGGGWHAGTLAYMAPENLRGAPPDARSDLFSLGVLLWELWSGAHPFEAPTLLDRVSAILHGEPSCAQGAPRIAASGIEPLLRRLLTKDPAARPADAHAVLAELDTSSEGDAVPRPDETRGGAAVPRPARAERESDGRAVHDPGGAAPHPHAHDGARPSRRRVALIAGALALLALALAWLAAGLPRLVMRPEVVVLAFDGDDGALAADLLAEELGDAGHLRAIGPARLGPVATASGPTAAAQVLKAPRYVDGRLAREGDGYRAALEIWDGAPPRVAARAEVGGASLPELARKLAAAVERNVLGEEREPARAADATKDASRTAGEGVPVAPLTPARERARLLDRRARVLLREERYAEAIAAWQRAVLEDPSDAGTRARFALALHRAGFERRAADEAQAARAAASAGPTGLPPRERLELDLAEAVVRGRPAAAVAAHEAALRLDGADAARHVALAEALVRAGRAADALAAADAALRLDAVDPRAHVARAEALGALGRRVDAAAELDDAARAYTLLETSAGLGIVEEVRGELAFNAGEYADAAARYRAAAVQYAAAGLVVAAARATKAEGDAHLKLGDAAAARDRYRRAEPVARDVGAYRLLVPLQSSLGTTLYVEGKFDEADRVLERAADEARRLEAPALLVPALTARSQLLAYLERMDEARPVAQEALAAARAAGDAEGAFDARATLASAAAHAGDFEDAAAAYRALADESGAAGSEERLAYALASLAAVWDAAERSAEALREIERAIPVQEELGLRTDLAYAFALKASLLAQLGRAAEARAAIAAGEELAPGGDAAAWLRSARARVELASGEPRRALELVDRASADLAGGARVSALLLRAEALVALGRPAEVAATLAPIPRTASAADLVRADLFRATALAALGSRGDARILAARVSEDARRMKIARTEGLARALF